MGSNIKLDRHNMRRWIWRLLMMDGTKECFVLTLWVLCSWPCCIKALPPEYGALSFPGLLRSGFSQASRASRVTDTSKKLENLYNKLIYWSDVGNNQSQCQASLSRLASDLMEGKLYAIKALDSTGKPESGVLKGNFKWLGRYYECIAINEDGFQGKWCSIMPGRHSPLTDLGFGQAVGICLPNTCTEKDVTNFLSYISNGSSIMLWTASCPVQPRQWNASDVIFVVVLSIFVILLISGTILEVYINNRKRNVGEILIDNDAEIVTEVTSLAATEFTGWEKALLSFSIIKNTKSLLNVERKPTTINCIHGVRFVSMAWVVLGHSFYFLTWKVDNIADLYEFIISHISFLAITNSVLAVDTFFFISGLLVAYLTARNLDRFSGKRVPMMYLQRYLRLTPSYAFIILLTVGFYGKFGNGPLWEGVFSSRQGACEKYWWTNLVYISNLYPVNFSNQCVAMGWYLSNDMQFFVLAPISLLILKRNRYLGLAVIIFGIFSSMLVTGVTSAHYDTQPVPLYPSIGFKTLNVTTSGNLNSISNHDDFWDNAYERPWCRIGAYLVGMIAGYILATTKCIIRMSKILVMSGWSVAAALNLTVLYGIWWHTHHSVPMEANIAGMYNAMSRPVWACGLAWVVVACATGNGGPVNTFLSWKALVPLSRLTYSIYLVQGPIIHLWLGSIEENYHFTIIQMPIFFLGLLTLASGVGYAFSMLVEIPLANLVKLLLTERNEAQSSNCSRS